MSNPIRRRHTTAVHNHSGIYKCVITNFEVLFPPITSFAPADPKALFSRSGRSYYSTHAHTHKQRNDIKNKTIGNPTKKTTKNYKNMYRDDQTNKT